MIYRYDFVKKGKVSLMGFGGWQLGNKSNWNGPDFVESVNLVKKAYESGINFFDTAPNYGDGNSEIIIGQALKQVRDKVFFNTKVGHGPDGEYEFTEDGLRKSIERSLKKLDTNYLDSVILHNPERYILEGKTNLFDVLKEMKEKGKIRKFGVSIDSLDEAKTVLDNLEVDTIEIMFNMIHQEPRYIFERIKEKNILLIIKVPLDSGWLSGKYGADSVFDGIRSRWNTDEIRTRAEIVEQIKTILGTDDISMAALKYVSNYQAVSTIIPGMKNERQLEQNIKALDYEISSQEMAAIEGLYENFIRFKKIPW